MVTTDADGRWQFPHAPRSYKELRMHLTCSNYAVTTYAIPLTETNVLDTTLIIRSGVTVIGRVVDTNNQPIAGARIREQHNYGWRHLSAQTDSNGWFTMRGVANPDEFMEVYASPFTPPKLTTHEAEQVVKFTVQAKGFSPAERSVSLTETTNYIPLVLNPAQIFRGRIVDDAGQPVAGAVIRTDWDFKNQIPTRFEWTARSDADGRFEWDSAPSESLCFWFEADGHEIIRSRPFVPDGTENEIVLKRLH
jgi:hypothetical protein